MTPAASRRRVLVIDDDKHIRDLLAFVLQTMGYQPILAANTADGVREFAQHRPAVVITDMLMPGAPGVEAVRAIRALSDSVFVIAMSGSDEGGADSMLVAARAAGANHCLSKPFDLADLEVLLDRAAARDDAGSPGG